MATKAVSVNGLKISTAASIAHTALCFSELYLQGCTKLTKLLLHQKEKMLSQISIEKCTSSQSFFCSPQKLLETGSCQNKVPKINLPRLIEVFQIFCMEEYHMYEYTPFLTSFVR